MSTDPDHDRLPNEPTDVTDLEAADDHAGDTRDTPQLRRAVRAGHEPDEVDLRPILFTGALLAGVVALAYVVVTIIFGFVGSRTPATEPHTNKLAVERSQAPLNDRLGRLGRETEGKQPRLEALDRLDFAEDVPPFVQSRLPLPEGNSPRLHPENIRPENVPALQGYSWIDQENNVARIPIGKAISLTLKQPEKFFPTQKANQEPAKKEEKPPEKNDEKNDGGEQ